MYKLKEISERTLFEKRRNFFQTERTSLFLHNACILNRLYINKKFFFADNIDPVCFHNEV